MKHRLLLLLLLMLGTFVSAWADNSHFHYIGVNTLAIEDSIGWRYFCDALETQDYAGKTIKLVADIGTDQAPITRIAGKSPKTKA